MARPTQSSEQDEMNLTNRLCTPHHGQLLKLGLEVARPGMWSMSGWIWADIEDLLAQPSVMDGFMAFLKDQLSAAFCLGHPAA